MQRKKLYDGRALLPWTRREATGYATPSDHFATVNDTSSNWHRSSAHAHFYLNISAYVL
ncbi:hypothetical protein H1R20_g4629, partial [Candolleomyces eurysporus]